MSNYKEAVRAVVTVNVALTALPSADKSDDVTLVANDRVVLIAQTAPEENGLWEVDTGAWSRPADSASTSNIESASVVFVEEGTRYKSAGFVLQNPNPIVVDTDPQTWFCFTQTGLPPGWINVRDFGALGDGTTDDSAAFAAALAAFPGVYYPGETAQDGTLYVPPGTYKLNENLWVSRAVRLLGASGFGEFGSHLKFAPYKGVYVVGLFNAPDLNDAQGATIESLLIEGGHPPADPLCFWNHPKWTASTAYSVGDVIVEAAPRDWDDPYRKFQSVDRYFECIVAGTTGATEPLWEATDYGITDAAVLTEWTANTDYHFNSMVWVAGRYDAVFFAAGPPYTPFVTATSGTNSAALTGLAIGSTASDGGIDWTAYPAQHFLRGDTIDDPAAAILAGQPVWVARRNAGVRVFRRCKIVDTTIRNFLNAGIELACSHQDARPSYSIGTQVENVQIRTCGGGIHSQFDDSGACYFQALDISGSIDHATPYGKDCTREFGIYDRSQFGSTYIGTQTAEVGGPHIFQTDPGSSSAFINCYTEGDNGDAIFLGPNPLIIGGFMPMTATSQVNGIITANDWRGVGSHMAHSASQGANGNVVLANPSLGFSSLEILPTDASGGFGWIYNMPGTDGLWSLTGDGDVNKPALRLTTMRSQNTTSYMVSLPRGYFLGQDAAHETLVTTGGSTPYDFNIRGGRRIVGDRNIDATLIKPNSFLESVVIESGFRGDANWLASSPVNSFNRAITFMANDNCIERDGYVYRCANSGVTDSSEPTPWPVVPTPFAGIQVWNGAFNSSSEFGGCYKEGDFVRPISANGFVYKCVDAPVGVAGVHEGHVGTAEPSWPTTLTVTVVDGQLTWECFAADTASFIDDGTAVWVCQGKVPTYGKANFIHNEGTAILPAGAGPITGVIDLGPLRSDELNVYRVTVRAQNLIGGDYAYFELEATWDALGNPLEAPSVTRSFPSPMLTDWDAALQLNGDRVEVAIQQDGAAAVTFTAIRGIF